VIVVLEVMGGLEGEADATVIPFDSTFGADFSAFMDHPGLPNTVYACHDYSRSVLSHSLTTSKWKCDADVSLVNL